MHMCGVARWELRMAVISICHRPARRSMRKDASFFSSVLGIDGPVRGSQLLCIQC